MQSYKNCIAFLLAKNYRAWMAVWMRSAAVRVFSASPKAVRRK